MRICRRCAPSSACWFLLESKLSTCYDCLSLWLRRYVKESVQQRVEREALDLLPEGRALQVDCLAGSPGGEMPSGAEAEWVDEVEPAIGNSQVECGSPSQQTRSSRKRIGFSGDSRTICPALDTQVWRVKQWEVCRPALMSSRRLAWLLQFFWRINFMKSMHRVGWFLVSSVAVLFFGLPVGQLRASDVPGLASSNALILLPEASMLTKKVDLNYVSVESRTPLAPNVLAAFSGSFSYVKHPEIALALPVFSTALMVTLGGITAKEHFNTGLGIIGTGIAIGPALGQFYVGNTRHGLLTTGLRAGGEIALLLAFQRNFCLSECSSGASEVLLGALGVGTVGLILGTAIYDIVEAPVSAVGLFHNAGAPSVVAHRKRSRWSAPLFRPTVFLPDRAGKDEPILGMLVDGEF